MSQNKSLSILSMEPLNVGNVVTAALGIYRDNFKSYCGVAIRATLWFLLPCLALIPIPLILVYGQASSSSFLLLVPVWLLLFAFCTTKSILNSAIIGRLVFGVLANKPETVREVRRTLAPKLWDFLWAFLGLFLIGIGVTFVVPVVIVFVLAIISVITNFLENKYIDIVGVGVALAITFFAISLILLVTLLNRFLIFKMPLVVEENMTATRSLRRSWALTKGYLGRILVILLVATLVALPIGMILYIFSEIFYEILKKLYEILRLKAPMFSGSEIDSSLELVFYIFTIVTILILPFGMTFGLIFGTVGVMLDIELNDPTSLLLYLLFYYVIFSLHNVLLLPFWQAIKAVIYYDLRTRREGMGFELRKREI